MINCSLLRGAVCATSDAEGPDVVFDLRYSWKWAFTSLRAHISNAIIVRQVVRIIVFSSPVALVLNSTPL